MFVEILTGEFDSALTKNKDMPSTHRRRILDGARPGSLASFVAIHACTNAA
jgi:hypothetical protein